MSKGTYSHSNRHRMHETNKTPDWMDEVDVSPREITPEYWQTLCDIETPSAVMVSGEQMTKLMKLQDENSDETALHIARELAKGRFEDIIKLEEENHEQLGRINELQKQLDELTHMHQAISMVAGLPRKDEMETLIKDGKRLDWLQSCDLSLHCPNEGDVWRKEGVYRIRQYIDKAMNQATQ